MFYDIHAHILPGFDDGAEDLDTSLAMLQIAAEQGTTGLVATPHFAEGQWLPAWERIQEACRSLSEAARSRGLPVEIYPGSEVAYYSGIEKIISGTGAYCINSSRYMLVELPGTQVPLSIEDFFFKLQTLGITPILAHPERNREIQQQPELLPDWVERGVLLQINGSSILGKMGETAQVMAERLLLSGMVHCIASDGHGSTSRRPGLAQAAQIVTELVGQSTAELVMSINPGHIIHNHDVTTLEPDLKRFYERPKAENPWYKIWAK